MRLALTAVAVLAIGAGVSIGEAIAPRSHPAIFAAGLSLVLVALALAEASRRSARVRTRRLVVTVNRGTRPPDFRDWDAAKDLEGAS